MASRTIRKTLSPNDVGETGGHQAGILIPKDRRILSFFPELNVKTRNPRAHIVFEDQAGQRWEFAFIYYNNRLFGGTRNEYRLTRMTGYIRQAALASGDEVILRRDKLGRYTVDHQFAIETTAQVTESPRSVLRLSGGWRIIDISN